MIVILLATPDLGGFAVGACRATLAAKSVVFSSITIHGLFRPFYTAFFTAGFGLARARFENRSRDVLGPFPHSLCSFSSRCWALLTHWTAAASRSSSRCLFARWSCRHPVAPRAWVSIRAWELGRDRDIRMGHSGSCAGWILMPRGPRSRPEHRGIRDGAESDNCH